MSVTEKRVWDILRERGRPYPPEAFRFVQEGLRFTVERLYDEPEETPESEQSHHVSGQELCLGLRDYAIEQYGLLARTVLRNWHIRRTEDFGRIVFVLLEAGLMRKTERDSIRDFAAVFDFDEAFGRPLERC